MYGYKCEYCEGTVQERILPREVFKHRLGFVILEEVPVGVCDQCGYRYYHASLLKLVDEIARKQKTPKRVELVPVGVFA